MKELVLFRHGLAEERGYKPDFDRALTPLGIQKTKAAAKGLAHLLKGKEITLISSPLVRAVQTAKILSKRLGVPFTEHPWIADGSRFHLRKSIALTPGVLIVVGHEPTLSDWHFELSGDIFYYKKAGAAMLRFDDLDEPAECVWAYTRKELAKIGEKK